MEKHRSLQRIFPALWILLPLICALLIWGFTTTYYGVSISPNGKILVVTSPYGAGMYQLSNGRQLHYQHGKPYGTQDYQGEFSYIAWSPDGTSLAVGKLHNGIWIWDTSTWRLLTEREGDPNATNEPGFAWSPNGQQLALGTGNGEIWTWNKADNKWALHDKAQNDLISITWTTDGQLLKMLGHEIYDVDSKQKSSELNHYIDGYGKASWSPDGSHVYIFFDLSGGVMDVKANKYEFDAGAFPKFAWSRDGRYFASVSECSNEITVWDAIENKIVKQVHQGSVIYALTWTSDNNLLALGVLNWQTVIWNTNTGKILLNLFGPPNLACLL